MRTPCLAGPVPFLRLLAACLLAFAITPAAADQWIVNPGESIQAAIAAAQTGDEVVVMPGTYTEALDLLGKAITVRSASGAEVTVLSGAGLGTHLVRIATAETSATVLKGFTLRGGNAALFIEGAGPTVRHCVFTENHGKGVGSGVRVIDGSAVFEGCVFLENRLSHGYAGAVSIINSTVGMTDCQFIGNSGIPGALGAFYSDLTLAGCVFQDNTAREDYGNGGAIDLTHSTATISQTRFTGNDANRGGGIFAADADMTLVQCEFIGNSGEWGAAGISVRRSTLHVDRCYFGANYRPPYGGAGIALNALDSTLHVRRSSFLGNVTDLAGGHSPHICGVGGTMDLVDSRFDGKPPVNVGFNAQAAAGVVSEGAARTRVVNCTFARHAKYSGGGGLSITGGEAFVVGCLFIGNTAASDGLPSAGGIYLHNAQTEVVNCTFLGNLATTEPHAPPASGAIFASGGNTLIRNTVMHGNRHRIGALTAPSQIGGAATVMNSLVEGGWPGGNIDASPMLFATADGHYRPLRGSPCVDAGDNSAVPLDWFDLDANGETMEPIPIDLRGRTRLVDDPNTPDTGIGPPPVVDIGAYELHPSDPPCGADWNEDGLVNSNDIAAFVTSWLMGVTEGGLLGDADVNGRTDSNDIAAFIAAWLEAVGGDC